jgi:hypothetical protein
MANVSRIPGSKYLNIGLHFKYTSQGHAYILYASATAKPKGSILLGLLNSSLILIYLLCLDMRIFPGNSTTF